MTQTFMLILD